MSPRGFVAFDAGQFASYVHLWDAAGEYLGDIEKISDKESSLLGGRELSVAPIGNALIGFDQLDKSGRIGLGKWLLPDWNQL